MSGKAKRMDQEINEPKAKRTFTPKVDTRLSRADITRLDAAAKAAGMTRSDFMRRAILFYLDNLERLDELEHESKSAEAIKYGSDQIVRSVLSATDRICGMLARQGAEVGTLYELTWRTCASAEAKEEFVAAANTSKQRQRKRLEDDELAIAQRTKKVVAS